MQTEPIRDKSKLQQLAGFYRLQGHYRNYVLIILGVHTALRISDLLQLSWSDVYDEKSGEFRTHTNITESKTGKQKTIALNSNAVAALRLLQPYRRGAYIFANNRKDPVPISRVQAWRIVKAAAESLNIAERTACHSLRKTFGYHAWVNGASPVVLMDIYNHSSFEVTRRYLGVAQDDRDKIYMELTLF